jgi:hypothetical protein
MPRYWLRWGLVNFFLELASNHDPPDLNHSRRQDYRLEALAPSTWLILEISLPVEYKMVHREKIAKGMAGYVVQRWPHKFYLPYHILF